MTWVWEQSKAEGLDRLVLLAIADNANDQGGNAYPSVETLRVKAKVSERTVQRAVRRLVGLGELRVRPGAGQNGVNVYTVVMTPRQDDTPSDSHPVTETPVPQTPGGVTESERGVTQSDSPRHSDTQTVLEPSGTLTSPNAVVARRRGTRLPENWRPSDTDRQWTLTHLDQTTAGRELEKFRNYWIAKAGKDATKLDWDRTWRNWVLNTQPGPSSKPKSTTDQRVADAEPVVAKFEAQEAEHAQV